MIQSPKNQNKSPDMTEQVGSSQVTSKTDSDTIKSEEAKNQPAADLMNQSPKNRIKIESAAHVHPDMIVEEHVLSPDLLSQTSTTYYADFNQNDIVLYNIENSEQSSSFASSADNSNKESNNNNSQHSENDENMMMNHLQKKLNLALNLKSSVQISTEEIQSLFNLLDQNSPKEKEKGEEEAETKIKSKSNKSKSKKTKSKSKSSSKEENSRIRKFQSQISSYKKQITSLTSEFEQYINETNAKIMIFSDGFRGLNAKMAYQDSLMKNMEQIQIRDMPTKVLSHIFDYLDIESLKQSRFVSRSWRFEAGKVMLEKYGITGDSLAIGKCLNSLKFWLNSTFTRHEMNRVDCRIWTFCVKNDAVGIFLLENIRILRLCIKKLKYQVLEEEEGALPHNQSSENLFKILKLLPNLELLETNYLNLSYCQSWIGYFVNGVPINIQYFLQQLARLKNIQLHAFLGPHKQPLDIFRHHQNFLSNIKEIKIRGMNFMVLFLNMKLLWGLEKVTMELTRINFQDVAVIRQFFGRIYPTLKHLKIIICYSRALDFNCENFSNTPWQCDWLIPHFLSKLETLEISIEMNPIPNLIPIEPSGNSESCQSLSLSSSSPQFELDPFIIKSIISALRLPQLKKLAVNHIPWDLEGVVYSWNCHEAAGGRKLTSQSLEELELLSQFYPSSNLNHLKIPGAPWPELKSLKCSWKENENGNQDENNNPNQNFISELTNLQKIELITKNGSSIFKHRRQELS